MPRNSSNTRPRSSPRPQEQQSVLEEYRQAQTRIDEGGKIRLQKYPDYMQSIKRLEPRNETPIPPTSYYHLMLNVSNAPDVGYHLSRHPELIAKLWSLESSGNGIQAMKELNDLSAGLRFQGSQHEGNTSQAQTAERERRQVLLRRSGPSAAVDT
jgi:hypothetical protein